MSTILPKGIVVNTEEISDDINPGEGEVVPVDQIARMWKVYTATHRRLLDPTAERLENYWWRIWGSRNMRLDGSVAARLFMEISFGPTVVPLLSPANRDESGGRPNTTHRPGTGVRDTVPPLDRHESDSFSSPHSSTISKEHQSHMPPPILKKSKGQSTSGPRPTARFVSPNGSEEDEATESSSDLTGGSRANLRAQDSESKKSVARISTLAPSDSITGPRRKGHVATTAGHKRRPGIVRRNTPLSSDSGVKTSHGAKETAAARNEHLQRNRQESSEDSSGPAKGQRVSKFQETIPPSAEQIIDKITSKKPRSTKSKLSKQSSTSNSTSTSDLGTTNSKDPNGKQREALIEAGSSSGLRGTSTPEEKVIDKEELDEEELKELELQEALLAEANARMTASNHKHPTHLETRDGSDQTVGGPATRGHDSSQSKSKSKQPIRDIGDKSRISQSSPRTAPESSLDLGQDHDDFLGKGKKKAIGQGDNLFAKRPVQSVPTASSLLASPPLLSNSSFGRSKSQLTLLLEQDRTKESDTRKGRNQQPPSK